MATAAPAAGGGQVTRAGRRFTGASRRPRAFLLFGALILAPFAFGTVHDLSRLVVFTLCAAALFLGVRESRIARGRLSASAPGTALAVVTGLCGLQLLPLPWALLSRLAPSTRDALEITGASGHWHALSLDPAATALESIKLVAYLAFFGAARIYTSRAHRIRRIVQAMAVLAVALAAVGLLQYLLGSPLLFFFTPNEQWGSSVRGPFVNPNHFGAVMVLGAGCLVAVALREEQHRVAAAVGLVIVNLATVFSATRASPLSLAVAEIVALLLAMFRTRRPSGPIDDGVRRWRIALTVILVVVPCLAYVLARESLAPSWRPTGVAELSDPLSKYQLWKSSLHLIADNPWFGIGPGTFEQAFTRVSQFGGRTRYQWIENQYLQVVADWGIPAGIFLLVMMALAAAKVVRRLDRHPTAVGAAAGLVGLAVHELFDFSTALPGVALPALALLAIFFPADEASEGAERTGRLSSDVHVALSGLCLLGAFGQLFLSRTAGEADALRAQAASPATRTADLVAAAQQISRRHPGDYLVPLVVGERLAREGDAQAMHWLNEATFLNPTHSGPHLALAALFARAGHKSQALLEYRTAALGMDPRIVWTAVERRYPATEDLIATCPPADEYRRLLGKWLVGRNKLAAAEVVYRQLIDATPDDTQALTFLAERALAANDLSQGRALADRLLDLHPDEAAAVRLATEARLAAGDPEGAARLILERADPGAFLDLEIEVAEGFARAGNTARALEILARAERQGPHPPALTARLLETRALVHEKTGKLQEARWERQESARARTP